MNYPAFLRGVSEAWARRLYVSAVAASLFGVAACQQKMADQPYFRPLEGTDFYPDGRASRPLEAGTVSLDRLPDGHRLMSGLKDPNPKKAETIKLKDKDGAEFEVVIPPGAPTNVDKFYDVFPFKMNEADLRRGMERFTIYCTPCHGPLGDGNGKIVERGYLKPTSFHGELSRGFARYQVNAEKPKPPLSLKDAPVGYYFEVISKGFGHMPDYSMQISPEDRWKIIAYIRALQLSQAAHLKDLPASVQETAKKAADETATEKHGGTLTVSSNEHAPNGAVTTNGNGSSGANAPALDVWQRYALMAGGIGLGVFIVIGIIVAMAGDGENSKRQFFVTYLAAWTFWLSLPVGCMGLLGIQYVTGASWGVLLRRLFEASCRTLPLLAALFVVIALSLASPATSPYPWSKSPAELTQSPTYLPELKEKFDDFCNVPGFLIRVAFYFAVWGGFIYYQNKWSAQVERTDDRKARRLVENLGGPMVVVFALFNMFAVTDLIMSLELTFSSTMFPLIYSINQMLIGFTFCVALFLTLAPEAPLKDVLRPKFQIDMGSFMLGLTLIWCYMNYSQYMLIWIGNMPEEIVYYEKRTRGGWEYLTYFQIICHFALPFILLLFRDVKLDRKRLRAMALFILFCCALDIVWWVEPTYQHGAPFYLIMDVAAFAGIGGIWVWAFLNQLKKHPLLPTNYLGQLPGGHHAH